MCSTDNSREISLLLLSGFLFDKHIWDGLCDKLPSEVTCYRWDMRDITSDSLETVAQNIVNQLPHQFYICGWSIGGNLALYIASKYPSRVKGIVTIATNPCFVKNAHWPGIDNDELLALYSQFQKNPQRALEAFLTLLLLGVKDKQVVTTMLTSHLLKKLSMMSLDVIFEQILRLDLVGILKQLQMPAEFIFFKKDKLIPWQVSHHLSAHQNSWLKTLVIPSTGHGNLVTSYDLIADRLGSML